MRKYFHETDRELLVSRMQLGYDRAWYGGRGVLEWKPKDGFLLRGFLERKRGVTSRSMGRSGVVRPADRKRVRLWFSDRESAVTHALVLVDRFDIVHSDYIRLRFNELHFRKSGNWERYYGANPSGWAVLSGVGQKPFWPDVIERRTRLAGGEWSTPGWSRSALRLGDGAGFRVWGHLAEDRKDLLVVSWRLRPRFAARGKITRWPDALARALSFIGGRVISVVESECRTATWRRRRVAAERDTTSFGPLALLDTDYIDPDLLRHLARFFFYRSRKARIAELIIDQVAAASIQPTLEATQLLVATILEAALRTLQERPFVPGRWGTWKARESLTSFREQYLSEIWRDQCESVILAWERLRHRNAHPTWLVAAADQYQADREVYSDLMLLTRFYGRMIMAMAGQKDLPLIPDPRV